MHRFEELGARHSHCSRWFSTISSLVGTPDRRTVFSSIHILVLYTSIRYALCPLFVVIILSHSLYITERYFLWVMKFMFCAALHSLAISTIQHLFGQHIAHYPTKSKRNKSVRNHSRKHEIEKKKKNWNYFDSDQRCGRKSNEFFWFYCVYLRLALIGCHVLYDVKDIHGMGCLSRYVA